jgi:dTDP-glucose 4,6-dehydratase
MVTGGAGFLGSHLCERLVEEGCDVVALDNLLTGTPDNIGHLIGHERFRLIKADVTEFVHITGPVHAVLHFASPASPADYLRLPLETLKVGSVGTLHALGLAKEKGARFLLASTSEVYGDPDVHPQSEDYWGHVDPVSPRGVYDEGKRFAEALTTAYRTQHGVDTAIARIFNTFGPRMRADDGRAVPTFIRQALAGEPLTVTGAGSQTRSLCFVSDVVDGVLRLLNSTEAGPVNIGNPEVMTVLDLAHEVMTITETNSTVIHIDRPLDEPSERRPDVSLASRVLGWEPQVSFRDGLSRTVDWFRHEGLQPSSQGCR